MKKNLFRFLFSLGLIPILISGCASPVPKEVGGKNVNEDLTFIKVLAHPSGFKGEVIIWGGVIIKELDSASGTDLYLKETPFDFRGRPKDEKFSEGMFIARTIEFLDSQKYADGQKVTVAGEIIGQELGTYQESPYVYPVVRIKEIHLWNKEAKPIKWNWGKANYYWPEEYTPDQLHRQSLP